MSDVRQAPWIFRKVLNPAVTFAVGTLGMPIRGGMALTVPGRKTGTPFTVVVYPLTHEGQRYLVAPRGETGWVKNLRASGQGTLRLGRQTVRFVATELDDAAKPPILRAYLDRWYMEAGAEFGVPKEATVADLAAVAHRHPVFRIEPAPRS